MALKGETYTYVVSPSVSLNLTERSDLRMNNQCKRILS